MPPYVIYIVMATMLAVMGALWYFAHKAEKQRTEAWRQEAERMGFEFAAAPGLSILGRFPGFQLFAHGDSKAVKNLLRGQASGLEVTVFDYSYVTGSGKSRHTWSQTVITFEFAEPNLPKFSLRPESVWDKIGEWFGYRDIDFDSHPRFSKSYVLRSEDDEGVRQYFAPHVLEYYEESPGVCTEASGGRLVYYRVSTKIAPTEVRTFMDEGFRVLALFRPPND
jgi:hypothetical protein